VASTETRTFDPTCDLAGTGPHPMFAPRSQLLAQPRAPLDCRQTGVISVGQGQPVY